MPNIYAATGVTQVASAVIAGLYNGGILVNTIWRDAETDYVAGKGDSVTVRSPNVIPAANFTGTATGTNLSEAKIIVNLDQMPYSQVFPNQKESTLYVEDFYTQVLEPQVAGIAEYIDGTVADALAGTTGTVSGADWTKAIAAASGELTTNKVPGSGRYLAVAGDVAGELLATTLFVSASDRGDGGTALENATLGRLYGFDVVVSPALDPGIAIAYHGTAVAGVFRTPTAPQGAGAVSTQSYRGITAQVIYNYDNAKLADGVTALTLYGLGSNAGELAKRALVVSVTP